MTPTEAVARAAIIAKEQDEILKQARQEQARFASISAQVKAGKRSADEIPEFKTVGKRRDLIKQATGYNDYQIRNAVAVIEAAKEDPERFGDLQVQMDQTGDIGAAWQELRRRRTAGADAEKRNPHVDKAEKAVIGAINGLAAICNGLALIDKADAVAIPRERAAFYATDMFSHMKKIRRFAIRRLGGRLSKRKEGSGE